jgi:hypothetical protein
MRVIPVLVLLAAALAGCMTPGPADDATAGRASYACPAGQAVTGFDAAGAPACAALLPARTCDAGQYLRGFDAQGALVCEPFVPSLTPPSPTGRETSQEVSSNLKVAGVYGMRNSTSVDLSTLKMQVELSAGALPMDLTKAIIRYSDGSNAYAYGYGSPGFSPTWIRGTNNSGVMSSGDLVEIQLGLGNTLAPRTSVQLTLIPETGTPVAADFKTPSTYSTDLVITLR